MVWEVEGGSEVVEESGRVDMAMRVEGAVRNKCSSSGFCKWCCTG